MNKIEEVIEENKIKLNGSESAEEYQIIIETNDVLQYVQTELLKAVIEEIEESRFLTNVEEEGKEKLTFLDGVKARDKYIINLIKESIK